MFRDKSRFRNYTPCHNISIRVAEGSSAKVLGTGDVGLHINSMDFAPDGAQ